MMTTKFSIIIVDDHQLFRQGVTTAITDMDFAEVIGEASNGIELLALLENKTPDAILMDIKMPKMDGITATEEVLKRYPDIKIVALSMFGDEEYLENIISAGACGFILKNTNAVTLEQAIRTISEDKQYFSEEFIPYFTNRFFAKKTSKEEPKISKRELQVLELIAVGYKSHEIANQLCISDNTVATHRANLISKTGSKNTFALLTYAIKKKLISIN